MIASTTNHRFLIIHIILEEERLFLVRVNFVFISFVSTIIPNTSSQKSFSCRPCQQILPRVSFDRGVSFGNVPPPLMGRYTYCKLSGPERVPLMPIYISSYIEDWRNAYDEYLLHVGIFHCKHQLLTMKV